MARNLLTLALLAACIVCWLAGMPLAGLSLNAAAVTLMLTGDAETEGEVS